jgi:hypothetical protein
VLRQNQFDLSAPQLRIEPYVTSVATVLGHDDRQETDRALASDAKYKIEILTKTEERVEPTDLLDKRLPDHRGRKKYLPVTSEKAAVLGFPRKAGADQIPVLIYVPKLRMAQADCLISHRFILGEQSIGQHAIVVVEERY